MIRINLLDDIKTPKDESSEQSILNQITKGQIIDVIIKVVYYYFTIFKHVWLVSNRKIITR